MQSLELVLWLLTPCLFFFLSCSRELISLIYEHGKMSSLAVDKTSEALWFYSLGLIAYGLIKVLSSFYYAIKKTSFAMKGTNSLVKRCPDLVDTTELGEPVWGTLKLLTTPEQSSHRTADPSFPTTFVFSKPLVIMK